MNQLFKRGMALVLATFAVLVISVSCGTTASMSGGLSDESYLVVAASSVYQGQKVFVSIDDEATVGIVAIRPDQVTRHAKRITITPGKHIILVHDAAGRKIFQQEIFVSTRSTKTITLR
jgi:lipoprotein